MSTPPYKDKPTELSLGIHPPPATATKMRSREQATSFLRNLNLSVDRLSKRFDASFQQLSDTPTDALPRLLLEQQRILESWYRERVKEWTEFASSSGYDAGNREETRGAFGGPIVASPRQGTAAEAFPPEGSPLPEPTDSIEQRLAAMGGIPALGAVPLPQLSPVSLRSTGGMAVDEMKRQRLRQQGRAASGGQLNGLAQSEDDQGLEPDARVVATPLSAANKAHTSRDRDGGGEKTDKEKGAQPATEKGWGTAGSELAAALQRRTQRLAEVQGSLT
jgi:hypothetical protein